MIMSKLDGGSSDSSGLNSTPKEPMNDGDLLEGGGKDKDVTKDHKS